MHNIEIINEILEELNSEHYFFDEVENLFEISNKYYSEHRMMKHLVTLSMLLNEKNVPHSVLDGYKVKLI